MPRYIVKLGVDRYVDWSTVVDAPVSWIKNRAEAVAAFGADRIDRADKNGHSATYFGPDSPANLVSGNRAGDNETELTLAKLIADYTPADTEGER